MVKEQTKGVITVRNKGELAAEGVLSSLPWWEESLHFLWKFMNVLCEWTLLPLLSSFMLMQSKAF